MNIEKKNEYILILVAPDTYKKKSKKYKIMLFSLQKRLFYFFWTAKQLWLWDLDLHLQFFGSLLHPIPSYRSHHECQSSYISSYILIVIVLNCIVQQFWWKNLNFKTLIKLHCTK